MFTCTFISLKERLKIAQWWQGKAKHWYTKVCLDQFSSKARTLYQCPFILSCLNSESFFIWIYWVKLKLNKRDPFSYQNWYFCKLYEALSFLLKKWLINAKSWNSDKIFEDIATKNNPNITHLIWQICLKINKNIWDIIEKKTTYQTSIFRALGLNRTGNMSFLTRQDWTPKFARQILPDQTESGLIFSNILPVIT